MSVGEDEGTLEAALRGAAARSPTPRLPDGLAALPWTVQTDEPGLSASRWSARWRLLRGDRLESAGRAMLAFGRLAVTVALAGAFLLALVDLRTGDGSPATSAMPAAASAIPTASSVAPAGGGPLVVILPTSGVVDDVMADYIGGGIAQAESDGAAAVVVQLDTLGGSSAATSRISKSLYASIPTIVWVGPAGAKAASAGTFITLSANLAYMAPGTNIGAASPVASNGQDIASVYGQTEATKVMNDAVAQMTSIAQSRHPQAVTWAVSTVDKAASYSASDALTAHGIDGIASSIDEVLAKATGQTVTVAGRQVTLALTGARTVTINENLIQTILHTLDDPNVAFVLLVLGALAVLFEFFHPTLLVGILGALCLALSFYGSGSLPLNILGVALVVLGLGMLVLEVSVPSHGLLTIGGLVCFIVGAFAFYGSPGPYLPGVSVAWPIIVTMTAAAAAYALILVRTLLQLRHQSVGSSVGLVGSTSPVGRVGQAETDLAPIGTVFVAGESWSARSVGEAPVPKGTEVRVLRQEGLTLVVEAVPVVPGADRGNPAEPGRPSFA